MLIDQTNLSLDKPLMSLSACSIQGKRNHMEDYFDIGYQMKPCDQQRPNEWPYEYFYFGIFDGHGGSEAASYAKKHLLKFITSQRDFWSDDDEDVMRAIRQGYSETHLAMRKEMHTWSRTSRILPSTAGTTASVLFIKNGKFYSGHVGDSRIVICQENAETKNWISRQITEDHKPESKQETDRIKRAGGEVRSKVGVHRVVWRRPVLHSEVESQLIIDLKNDSCDNTEMVSSYPVSESLVDSYQTIPFLAIARSLGDFWSLNPYSGQYTVSPEPDVECRPITPNDKSILLGTDGLWNVINSSYAVKLLQELDILKSGRRECNAKLYYASDNFYDVAGVESENHAQSLVYFAYQNWERRRLRSDNITVVVAMLHDIFAHFQALSNQPHPAHTNATSDKENLIRVLPDAELVQLGQTNSFFERVLLNREPLFDICNTPQRRNDEKWQKLESFLILPPTLLEQECDFAPPKIGYPRNYLRLSHASCRRIPRPECQSDNYIYIKHVSDDPADDDLLPTRISKSGKQVRDASAQATQSIHDFGQPWDQLIDASEENATSKKNGKLCQNIFDSEASMEDNGTSSEKPASKPDYDSDLIFVHELVEDEVVVDVDEDNDDDDDDDDNDDDEDDEDEDEDTELVFAHELDDDHEETTELVYRRQFERDNQNDGDDEEDSDEEDDEVESPETYRRSRSRSSSSATRSSSADDKSSIPQLRCLLNYTPPLRRSARNSGYLSVSDNAKRKSQLSSKTSRSKRRKSQPTSRALETERPNLKIK